MSKQSADQKDDPANSTSRGQGVAAEGVPDDDRVIGLAFRVSLGIVAAITVIGLASWLLLQAESPQDVVEEAPAAQAQSLSKAIDTPPPLLPFSDITQAAGIDFTHSNGAYGERLLPETMGGGVAVLDYDRDGRSDLLFVDSRTWPWREEAQQGGSPRLYRNLGNGRFEDVTSAVGLDSLSLYGMGVSVADIDGDGFRDLYLTAVGPNLLLRNVEGRRFEDVTDALGVAGDPSDWSTSAAFFDADNDGDLDLFVCNYVEWSREIDQKVDYRLTGIGRAYGPPTNYAGTFSRLYRNDGDVFTDVSAAAGIQVTNPATGLPAGKSLAVLPIDLDEDGWLDLVVANDTVRNFLFHNLGDGRFEEVGMASGIAFDNTGSATGAMGLDAAHTAAGDQLAVAVGNFANEMTSFYVSSRRQALFTDQSIVSGIGPGSRQALSFGLFFFDADLDGRLELLQTNGHVEDEINVVQPSQHYEQPTQLFWNCGPDCGREFVLMDAASIADLAQAVVGRGASYADLDDDGDLDVIITQIGRRPLLLRNEQSLGNHWLQLRVAGIGLNQDAIGARVVLTAGDRVQERTIMPTRSYLSQTDLLLTFGLGDADIVDRIEVHWPDGHQRVLTEVEADQRVEATHPRQPET